MRMILIIFQKKDWGKWTILGPKMVHSHNSGSAVRSFLKNGLYQKNFVHDKWVILVPKMAHPLNSGSAIMIFLKFYRMKGANRYIKILFFVFREKKSFWEI